MQTSVKFNTYTKTVYTENRSHGHKGNRLELNQQHYEINGQEDNTHSLSTLRLVFNTGFNIDSTYFESLLPDATRLGYSENNHIDSAFNELNHCFHQYKPGKSFTRWQEGAQGFGPCLAFNASYKPTSQLYTNIESLLLDYGLNIDGDRYRIIDKGVGFYLGPKGKHKQQQRSSSNIFPISDPTSTSNRTTYSDTINLDLRFALARVEKNNTNTQALLSEYDFFHGRHPLISLSLSIHLRSDTNHNSSFNCGIDLEDSIVSQIKPFRNFIVRNIPENNVLKPDLFKSSGHWSIGEDSLQRAYAPTMKCTAEQRFNTGTELHTQTLIQDLNPITSEFCHTTPAKKSTIPYQVEPLLMEKDVSFKQERYVNRFSILSSESSSDEEYSDDQSDNTQNTSP